MRRGSISSEQCFVIDLVARDIRCMYMAHVCFMSIVVTVWGYVGMFSV